MKKKHYAWIICLAGIILMFCNGLVSNGFSIYLPSLRDFYHITNTQSSLLVTIRCLFAFLSMLVVKQYYSIFSLRAGTTLAIGILFAGFLSFSFINSYAGACIGSAFMGISFGLGTMIPVSLLIHRWFRRKQALALGISAAGSGLAPVVTAPILTALLNKHSLSFVFGIEAAFIAVIGAMIFLLVRNSPGTEGPYGTGEETGAEAKKLHCNADSGGLFGKNLWIMLIAIVIMGFVASPGPAHFSLQFIGAGYSNTSSAYAISVFGVFLMAGKCIYGMLTDKMGAYRTNFLFLLILAFGLAFCSLLNGASYLLLYGSVILMGIGFPTATVGLTVWASELSNESQYDGNVQRFQTAYIAGNLIGSSVPGMIADWTGSYALAYGIYAGLILIILFMVQRQYRIQQRHKASVNG